jgi:hypothetical protein
MAFGSETGGHGVGSGGRNSASRAAPAACLPGTACLRLAARYLLLFLAVIGLDGVQGQPPDPPGTERIPSKLPDLFQKGSWWPDSIYLLDEQGNPIWVPTTAYEEFERFLGDRRSAEKMQAPVAILESMVGEVVIRDATAEFQWQLRAKTLDPTGAPARLGIGLANQHWRTESPETALQGDGSLQIAAQGGYDWLLPEKGVERPEIRFTTVAKITGSNRQRSLMIPLPDAPVVLKLRIAGAGQEVQVRGSGFPTVEVEPTTESTAETVAVLRVSGGPITLSWQPSSSDGQLVARSVETITRVTLNGEGRPWSCSTRMLLPRGEGFQSPRWEVRLPPGARWVAEPGASIDPLLWTEVKREAVEGEAPGTTLMLDARSAEGTGEAMEATLGWEWPAEWVAAGGRILEVPWIEGVTRHEGRLEVEVPRDHRFAWEPSPGVAGYQLTRPTEGSPKALHNFRFVSQPFSLTTVFEKLESRWRPRPLYGLGFAADRIQLEGLIEFPNATEGFNDLQVQLKDWTLESVEVDGRRLEATLDGEFWLCPEKELASANGITSPTPSNSPGSLRFSAYRPWTPDGMEVRIELPKISVLAPASGERMIDQGAGLLSVGHVAELQEVGTHGSEGMRAELAGSSGLADLLPEPMQESSRWYRFQGSQAPAAWSGRWTVLPAQQLARRNIVLRVGPQSIECDQEIALEIRNRPLNRFVLLLPRFPDDARGLPITAPAVRWNGKEIQGALLDRNKIADPWNTDFPVNRWDLWDFQVDGPVGQAICTIRSVQPIELPLGGQWEEWNFQIPGPAPSDALQWLGGDLKVEQSDRIECDLAGSMDAIGPPADSFSSPLRNQRLFELPMKVRRVESLASDGPRIWRCWQQTTARKGQQRDRIVMQLQSSLRTLRVRVDQRAPGAVTEFFIDGKPAAGQPLASNDPSSGETWELVLPESTEEAPMHQLEIWSWKEPNWQWVRDLRGVRWSIEGATWMGPLMWEAVLPRRETLLWTPGRWSPEYQWHWTKEGWNRLSNRTSSDLELWASGRGEGTMSAIPSSAADTESSKYLFSSLGPAEQLQMMVVPRSLLWGATGTILLLVAWCWRQLGVISRWRLIPLAALALLGLAGVSSDWAWLMMMAVPLALLLWAVVAMTEAMLRIGDRRTSVFGRRGPPIERWPRPQEAPAGSIPSGAPSSGSVITGPASHGSTQEHPQPLSHSLPGGSS